MEVNSIQQVADAFGVTRGTVRRWKQGTKETPPFPELQSKPFDLDAIGRRKLKTPHGNKLVEVPAKVSLEERKLTAQTKIAEIKAELGAYKLAVETGRLVDAEDIEEIVSKQSQEFRQCLTQLPKQRSYLFVGLETVEQAEDKLRQVVLEELGRLAFVGKEEG